MHGTFLTSIIKLDWLPCNRRYNVPFYNTTTVDPPVTLTVSAHGVRSCNNFGSLAMKRLAPESHNNSTMMVIRLETESILAELIVAKDFMCMEFMMDSTMGARKVFWNCGDND